MPIVWTKTIKQLNPGIAVSYAGIEAALEVYAEENQGAVLSTLLVSLADVGVAYRTLIDNPDLPRLCIVPVPEMHQDTWIAVGSHGIVISEA